MRSLLVVVCLSRWASAAPIGALDVDLAATDKGYVLSDSTFEVTFPTKPQLDTSPTTTPAGAMPGCSAFVDEGSVSYGVSLIAAPHDLAYDLARGLAGARDQTLAAVQAALVSDQPDHLGGRAARHVVGKSASGSQRFDLYLQWDGDHRTMILVLGLQKAGAAAAPFQSFVASFKRHDSVRWPIDPPAPAENTPEPTKVLDFELVRHGARFTVRDSLFEATFPARPLVTKGDAVPATGMDARTYVGEADLFSTGVLVVPVGTPFDTAKVFDRATELYLSDLTDVKHVDKPGKVAGLDGKHVEFTGKKADLAVRGELHVGWDPARRILVIGIAYTPGKALAPMHRAFLSSLTIHSGGALHGT